MNRPIVQSRGLQSFDATRRDFLGPQEMFLPTMDFPNQINSARPEFLEASLLRGQLTRRKSPFKNIRKDFAVRDLIVCPKSPRRKIPKSRLGGTGL